MDIRQSWLKGTNAYVFVREDGVIVNRRGEPANVYYDAEQITIDNNGVPQAREMSGKVRAT